MKNDHTTKERSFSIELKSIANLKQVIISNSSEENVLIEGTIGKLQSAQYTEGIMLEIVGKKGILRVDLIENELKEHFIEMREKQ